MNEYPIIFIYFDILIKPCHIDFQFVIELSSGEMALANT